MRVPTLLLCALVALAPLAALAAPPDVGARLPDLKARDVNGAEHQLHQLVSPKGPALVVAIADRDGADGMQAWFDAADTRAPSAARVSIVSIHVPFFVSDDYARSKAREKVPEKWRSASLFDSDAKMAKQLGIEGKEPWVFVVAPDGQVLARAHGAADGPEAEAIWRALKSARR